MPRKGALQRDLLAHCRRFSGRHLIRILLMTLLLTVAVTLFWNPILPQTSRSQRNRELELVQRAFVQDVERLGGHIVLAPASSYGAPQSLLAVDLGGATIDGDLIKRLSDFTTIQRLNLDGVDLAREDFRAIDRLNQLRNLSLCGATFSDKNLPLGGPQLTTLSLHSTSMTDSGRSRLAGMARLVNLDISDTSVTAKGLSSLRQLTSLKTLIVDDSCVTPDSVQALQSVNSLEIIRIHVAHGLGRQTKELVNPLAGSASVLGLHPSGHLLWDAERPWEETLAGVVEAVAEEAALQPRRVTQLIEAIGPTDMTRPQMGNFNRARPQPEKTGKEIESVDDFLVRLQNSGSPTYEILAFARDSFTKDHVPKLLDALRGLANLRDAEYLSKYGSYLLVRDGLENPEAARELDGMLSHEDPWVRSIAAYAFDQNGHPFGEDWAPSERAVEFGLPRLLRLSEDPDKTVQLAVTEVLGNLVHHHPNRASEVMPVLIGMLEKGNVGYVNYAIRRIVKVNPDAGKACIPQIRRLLGNTNDGTSTAQLNEAHRRRFIVEALFDMARGDPESLDYLGLIRDRSAGGQRLATLVSPANSEAVRIIVYELLDMSTSDNELTAEYGRGALVPVAKAIRDFRAAKSLPHPALCRWFPGLATNVRGGRVLRPRSQHRSLRDRCWERGQRGFTSLGEAS